MPAPRFVKEDWLDYSGKEWELKEGAPQDIVKEFYEYMEAKSKESIDGMIIDY